MEQTPPSVTEVLSQLEPILTEIYEQRGVGEVAIVYGNNQFQVEHRPRYRCDGVPFQRDWGRVKVLKQAGKGG